MKFKSRLLTIILILLIFGCAGQHASANVSGPFVTYSHETFIQKESGETGLFVDGEDWYSLINLKGFEDIDMQFTSPSQFLFQENDNGIRISAFAGKIPGVIDANSCLNRHVPKNAQKLLNNKTVGILGAEHFTSIYYYPFYKGYCFDFHFSTSKKVGIDEISKIIDTIKFVDGPFSKAVIKKFIYYGYKRIQLSIPDNWGLSFKSGNDGTLPSIVFSPKRGNEFKIFISLFTNKDGSPISVEDVKSRALESMTEISKESIDEPSLQEITNKKNTVYYYIAADKNYKPNKTGEYPLMCQGYTAVEGSILYFTILYHGKENTVVKQGLDVVTNARVLSLK